MRFPAEARRDVHVRYTRPSCMGGFAWFTVDSLPWTHARAGWRAAEKSWRGAEATDDPMDRAP